MPKAVFNEKEQNELIFYYDDIEHAGQVYDLRNVRYKRFCGCDWITGKRQRNKTNRKNSYKIQSVSVDASFKKYKPKSIEGWFSNLSHVRSIDGLEFIDTTNIKNIECLFYGCDNLTSLDLSSWDTSNVVNMRGLFFGCEALQKVEGIEKLNTSNVKNMAGMFTATKFQYLNLSSWDTSKVEDMECMFAACAVLYQIKGLERWDTSNVKNMAGMFDGCKKLKNIDVDKFNVHSLTNCWNMFKDCSNLKTLNLANWEIHDLYCKDFSTFLKNTGSNTNNFDEKLRLSKSLRELIEESTNKEFFERCKRIDNKIKN